MRFIDKIKNNQVIIFLKKLLSNKRYRSIIILFFWFLFFLFVVLILRTTEKYKQPQEENYTVPEILDKIENYNFNYEIKKDDLTYNVKGNYIDNETILNIDDKKYYITDNIYIIENEVIIKTQDEFELDLWKINLDVLYKLIKDKNVLYETINNNIKTTVYKVTINEFSNIIGENLESDENIEINVETQNNKYKSIYIDLTKYMNYNELKYRNYSIRITLDSINDVKKSSYNELIEGE